MTITQITKTPEWRLFWLSFLILFLEIMAIRWLGIEMPTIRAFPNAVMMGILIATSAGLILSGKPEINSSFFNNHLSFLLSTFLILGILIAAPQIHLYQQSIHLQNPWWEIALSIGCIFLVMLSIFVIFTKLGYLLGPLFNSLPPLNAYAINLIGSIAGTTAFSLISYFCAPPTYGYLWQE